VLQALSHQFQTHAIDLGERRNLLRVEPSCRRHGRWVRQKSRTRAGIGVDARQECFERCGA
jgi:hypothetical protein